MSRPVPFPRFPDFPISRFPDPCMHATRFASRCRTKCCEWVDGPLCLCGRLLRAQQRTRCIICTLLQCRRCQGDNVHGVKDTETPRAAAQKYATAANVRAVLRARRSRSGTSTSRRRTQSGASGFIVGSFVLARSTAPSAIWCSNQGSPSATFAYP